MLNNLFVKFQKIIHKKLVCIIGVDGSGKSTTVNKLKEVLGDKIIIQYMGFNEYELSFVKKYFDKGASLYSIKSIILTYVELWYRYLKNRFKSEVVIYDRYPWEVFLNTVGLTSKAAYIIFYVLFPKPKIIYYLHCSEETSISRKKDIVNVERFKRNKSRFDNYFMNKEKVLSYSTDSMTTEEIVDEIVKDLDKYI